jgi:hypothetical protein
MIDVWKALSEKKVLAPYVQTSLLNGKWPDLVEIPNPNYHDSKIDDYYHPSTHALYGERAIYMMLHPDERHNFKRKQESYDRFMTPLMGTVYHVIIQQNLVSDGLVKPEDIEIPLIDEKRHWRGHADLKFKGELVDIKSMNSRSFNNISTPYTSWKYQLHPYMDAMGLKTSLVLVVEQGMPWGMKEFRINFDKDILNEIYDKWERVGKAIKANIPPTTCCKPENSTYCPINCGGKAAPTP